jgi:hypothetical protein
MARNKGGIRKRQGIRLIFPSTFSPTLNANNAYRAATQRFNDAESLFRAAEGNENHYTAVIYISGLAVECLLTAYVLKINPSAGIPSNHAVLELVKLSGFLDLAEAGDETKRLNAAVQRVVARWRNEMRYFDDNAFIRAPSLLNKEPPTEFRGDLRKAKQDIARKVIAAARVIRDIGGRTWKS